MSSIIITAVVAGAAAFGAPALGATRVTTPRAALIKLFEEAPKDDVVITSVTRSRAVGAGRTGSIVVTDGSGSFYGSRTCINMLHDFGRYASIVALSDSVADAKKSLISRAGRYSGLLDVLRFDEEASSAFDGASSWLAISPDEAGLSAQIDAAASAGVSRAFVLLSSALPESSALEDQLAASGMEYTVMRTGPLVDGPSGVGLKIGELDMPVCEDVPKEDVFRFVTEALTLPEANGRAFSLCPSIGTSDALKQMRLCGYERRDEVQVLLKGGLPDSEVIASEEAAAEEEKTELVLRSEAEIAEERAEELKALLARAKQRGIETQQKLAYEEAERLAFRKEQEKYYKAPSSDDTPDSPPAESPSADAPEDPPKA